MPVADYGEPNCWLATMLVDPDQFGMDCEALRQALERENLEARRVWKPMHRQPVFAGCRFRGGRVSDQIFAQGISLPSGTAMDDVDRRRVVNAVRAAHQQATGNRAASPP
jgi:pyridoxal phosphate-dependent aminotransferase EpsN